MAAMLKIMLSEENDENDDDPLLTMKILSKLMFKDLVKAEVVRSILATAEEFCSNELVKEVKCHNF